MANWAGTSGAIRHRLRLIVSRIPGTDPPRPTTPIACSLDAGGLRTQERRWAELLRGAGLDRAATVEGVALTFRASPDVERELRELVAVENECCAWAQWEVRPEGDGGLVMQASAGGDGVAVLQSMFPPAS
jgi:hypothetical protein